MADKFSFFLRSRPQGADIIDLVKQERRVFIGYPIHLAGKTFQPHDLLSCIADLSSDISKVVPAGGWRSEYTSHYNLVRDVPIGGIVVIPRPSTGCAHIARIAGPFELNNDPPWAESYLQLRAEQNLETDDEWHVADVCQSWSIDSLKSVPLALVPAWIRRSFAGRSSFGRLYDHAQMGSAAIALIRAAEGEIDRREWTLDEQEVTARLLTDLNPTSFEHLVVGLLQLENPSQVWVQTGGPGDGGVDGIGYDPVTGRMTGLLQCKFGFWQTPDSIVSDSGSVPIYLAALEHEDDLDGLLVFNRHRVAQLLIKHRDRLPQALSLRVGSGGV